MSGGHLDSFKKTFSLYLVFGLIITGALASGTAYILLANTVLDREIVIVIVTSVVIIASVIVGNVLAALLIKPTQYLAQAIYHISPNEHLVAAPNVDKLGVGRELVANLTRQIYDLSSNLSSANIPMVKDQNSDLLDSLPVSVLGLNDQGNIAFANTAAISAFSLGTWKDVPLTNLLNMKSNSIALPDWIAQTKQKSINATTQWQKVEVSSNDGTVKSYYDVAAHYRQKHPSGIETLLVFFSHYDQYDQEETALSMIALSVHEIRTPLTIMRGYVEALQQEMAGKVDSQTQTYIDRLGASTDNLTTFMTNILSVLKVDQNQLNLQLQESSWEEHITSIVANSQNRASVRGKTISLSVAPNLPRVGIDNISLGEVITNLIDNAIKYSPDDKKSIRIEVKLDTDGAVLTTVSDDGVGIPDSVVPNLFNRFYRNHRNRHHISGSGLGLYLCKEIISAHHGNIWVKSKEGEGTTIGFTLMPFSQLDEADKSGASNGFTPVAHGWIKNHSMQRR